MDRLSELLDQYRHGLLDDVVPFWLKNSLDREHGGYFNCLDRDGSVYNTDKAMWMQCRETWLFSTLYTALEARDEWLAAAKLGYEFITKNGFEPNGRMFFLVTREGKPLRQRRYLFTESFGVIACAAYARASGDEHALQRAKATYKLMVELHRSPGALPSKIFSQTRQTKTLAMPMILVATTQELRQVDADPRYAEIIDEALDQILHHFMKPEEQALFETVGMKGERLDSPEGRCVNPGHAIETAWFMMTEGRHRNDSSLIQTAGQILKWSLEWGWDKEHGGLLYFVDVEGKPPEQLEWDMKLWWPHTEALYALLLAHHLTGERSWADWYERIHDWSFKHFPDPKYGEWFGYLHRDGSVALQLKGSLWKGAFHLPRALLNGVKLLEKMIGQASHV